MSLRVDHVGRYIVLIKVSHVDACLNFEAISIIFNRLVAASEADVRQKQFPGQKV